MIVELLYYLPTHELLCDADGFKIVIDPFVTNALDCEWGKFKTGAGTRYKMDEYHITEDGVYLPNFFKRTQRAPIKRAVKRASRAKAG